jgi:DNA adenine methylase
MKSFLKWVGGKQKLFKELSSFFPKEINNYYEPFIGGGSVYFNLSHKITGNVNLSDLNSELVNTYNVVKNHPNDLIDELYNFQNTKNYFLFVRSWDRNDDFLKIRDVKRAARFIYLNKTCYNGMWRVNSKNQYNVPYGGYKKEFSPDIETIKSCSLALQKANIKCHSFQQIMNNVKGGDFVYLDPPYIPLNVNSFVSYTQNGFSQDLHLELKNFCWELTKKGVYFVQSNSSSPLTYSLFEGFDFYQIEAHRFINSKADRRGKIKECVISNTALIN